MPCYCCDGLDTPYGVAITMDLQRSLPYATDYFIDMNLSTGANPLTLAGLGGMGDLVLTCTGDASRNR